MFSLSSLYLSACVIDSAPSPLTVWPYYAQWLNWKALNYMDVPLLFPLVFLPIVYGYFDKTLRNQSFLKSIWRTAIMAPWSFYYYMKYGPNAWGGQYLRNIENENWPLLFLYSVQDNQMPHTYIDGIIDVKRTQNPMRLISSQKFQKSSHVSHFRKYPEEYKGKVEEFLCKLK